VFYKH